LSRVSFKNSLFFKIFIKILIIIKNSLQNGYFVLLIIKYLNFSRLQGGRYERDDRNDDLRHGF
jgi:hypothetical protein